MTTRSKNDGPSGLEALESEDGEVAILSFPLTEGSASSLTPAESEVACHLLAGRSNAEIASLRGSSLRTVANQVASVFRKLDVRSRLELVAFAPLLQSGGPRREAMR
ncbi:MAG TPA: helix-turn-helix transcriptional regulator [Polyangiaceae bacterium]